MIVLDSSFLIGFYNERDVHHGAASALMQRLLDGEWGGGLLLECVFLEVVTVLIARRDLTVASHVGRLLLEAEELEFITCSDLFTEAFETFVGQGSTTLSFADVAIAHVARQRADGLVLTFDDEVRNATGIRAPEA